MKLLHLYSFAFFLLSVHLVSSSICEISSNDGTTTTASINAGQTFVSPVTGNLRTVALASSSSVTGLVELFAGTVLSTTAGTSLASANGTYFQNNFQANFTSAPVVAGSTYTLLVTPSASLVVSKGTYANGTGVLDGASVDYDLAFSLCFSAIELESSLGFDAEFGDVVIESLTQDAMGNTIVIGDIAGNISLGGQEYIFVTGAAFFIAKYDNSTNHNLMWSQILTTTGQYSSIFSVDVGEDGGIGIGGSFQDTLAFPSGNCSTSSYALYLAYFAPNGTELWHRCYETPDGWVYSVSVSEDALYAGMDFSGEVDFDGQTAGQNGIRSAAVGKWDLSGQVLWVQAYLCSGSAEATTLTPDSAIAVSLYCRDNFTLNGTQIVISDVANVVVKLSADGSLIWYYIDYSGFFNGMSSDAAGNILGAARGWTDTELGPYIVKFSNNGELLWRKMFVSTANNVFNQIRSGYQNTIFVIGQADDDLTVGGDLIPGGSGLLASFTADGDFLWQSVFSNDWPYPWGLFTQVDSKTTVWGSSFQYNATVDSHLHTATDKGSFIHWYHGEYVDGTPAAPSPSPSPSPSPGQESGSATLEVAALLLAIVLLISL